MVREDNSSAPPPLVLLSRHRFWSLRGEVTARTRARRERPASPDDTPLHSCLLLTSFTLVFYQLKVTENRESEEEWGGGLKKKRKKKKPVWLQTSPRGCYDALSGKTRTNRYTSINSSSELQDLWGGGEKIKRKKQMRLNNTRESFSLFSFSKRLLSCQPVIGALCIPR